MDRHAIAMATCGVCLCLGGVGLVREVCGGPADELKHFTAVRFRVPPGSVVTVNGRRVGPTVYLDSRAEYAVCVWQGDRILLARDRYRPSLTGSQFDLVPRPEVAPPPRPVAARLEGGPFHNRVLRRLHAR